MSDRFLATDFWHTQGDRFLASIDRKLTQELPKCHELKKLLGMLLESWGMLLGSCLP